MLATRSTLRRVRNRRVLSKAITRSGSHTVNDSPTVEGLKVPIYAVLLSVIALLLYVGTLKTVAFFVVYLLARRIGIFRKVRQTFKAYRARKPHHGPTFREKCLYNVDYWLSTNSCVQAQHFQKCYCSQLRKTNISALLLYLFVSFYVCVMLSAPFCFFAASDTRKPWFW